MIMKIFFQIKQKQRIVNKLNNYRKKFIFYLKLKINLILLKILYKYKINQKVRLIFMLKITSLIIINMINFLYFYNYSKYSKRVEYI
jgi:hypothetical protein